MSSAARQWQSKQAPTSSNKRTLDEAFRQILGLEVVKLPVGSSIGFQKTSDGIVEKPVSPK
jgi:hypothetical protein